MDMAPLLYVTLLSLVLGLTAGLDPSFTETSDDGLEDAVLPGNEIGSGLDDTDKNSANTPAFYVAVTFGVLCALTGAVLALVFIYRKLSPTSSRFEPFIALKDLQSCNTDSSSLTPLPDLQTRGFLMEDV